MKISARNALKGTVTDIREGVVTAVVTIDIGGGNHVVSSITMESVQNLGLSKGSDVTAIIKASNVMLAVD
jgi:molybdopterin-binding protein